MIGRTPSRIKVIKKALSLYDVEDSFIMGEMKRVEEKDCFSLIIGSLASPYPGLQMSTSNISTYFCIDSKIVYDALGMFNHKLKTYKMYRDKFDYVNGKKSKIAA